MGIDFPQLGPQTIVSLKAFTPLLQAHLRRHVKIHKRTENYSPRQRKLRNVVVQELEGNPEDNKVPGASLVPAVVVVGGGGGDQDVTTKPEADPQQTGLSAGCIVDVVIDSSGVVMEANLGHIETAEGLAMPEVLQQSEMVTQAFESSMEMAEMVESISESKS